MTNFINFVNAVPTAVYVTLTVILSLVAVWVWYRFIKFVKTEMVPEIKAAIKERKAEKRG